MMEATVSQQLSRRVKPSAVLATLVLAVVLISLLASGTSEAAAVSQHNAAQTAATGEGMPAGYNNLENLISEFLDDAGDRLKKSRMSSRQVKHTLRFGRRSDPMMAPGFDPVALRDLQDSQILAELGY